MVFIVVFYTKLEFLIDLVIIVILHILNNVIITVI